MDNLLTPTMARDLVRDCQIRDSKEVSSNPLKTCFTKFDVVLDLEKVFES